MNGLIYGVKNNKLMNIFTTLLILLITACTNPNYYSSKQFKIKQRKEESIKMYNRVHSVRVGCTPKAMRKSRTKTRARYTN